jgi:hypothetical protein
MGYRLTKDGFLGRRKGDFLTAAEFRAAFDSDQAANSRLGSLLRTGLLVEEPDPKPKPAEPKTTAKKKTTTRKSTAKRKEA